MSSPRWIFGFAITASKANKALPGTIGISSPGNSYLSNVSRTSNSTNSNSSLSSTWSSLFRKTTISFLIYQENTVQQSFVIDQEIRM